MAITVVFDPPLPTDPPATFDSKAFTLLGDLNDFATEANALQADVNAKQGTATTAAATATSAAATATSAAATATSKADEASTSATNAASSASAAASSASAAAGSAVAAATFDPASYVPKAGNVTMTGPLSVPAGASGAQVPQAQEVSAWTQSFAKADPSSVVFTKTGAATLSIKAGTHIAVGSKVVSYTSATAITMPTHAAGTDYAVWVKDDGSIEASSNHTTAPGAGTWRKIGGYHYAPGGNATARAGGDTTPAINEYSLWDLKFRPACPDPRGMTLVADSFWSDIYLLGVDHIVNGTSKYNVTIADGSSPPKIPTKFGGNGSTAYANMTWWVAGEVLQSHGKSMPTYSQFAALAFGTTEATSGGTDPVSTVLRAAYTSKWGVMLSTGNMWIWGDEFGGGAAAAAWTANTDGRGSTNQMENAVLFGCDWAGGAVSGSRASGWSVGPTNSPAGVGARGVCDHLILV